MLIGALLVMASDVPQQAWQQYIESPAVPIAGTQPKEATQVPAGPQIESPSGETQPPSRPLVPAHSSPAQSAKTSPDPSSEQDSEEKGQSSETALADAKDAENSEGTSKNQDDKRKQLPKLMKELLAAPVDKKKSFENAHLSHRDLTQNVQTLLEMKVDSVKAREQARIGGRPVLINLTKLIETQPQTPSPSALNLSEKRRALPAAIGDLFRATPKTPGSSAALPNSTTASDKNKDEVQDRLLDPRSAPSPVTTVGYFHGPTNNRLP